MSVHSHIKQISRRSALTVNLSDPLPLVLSGGALVIVLLSGWLITHNHLTLAVVLCLAPPVALAITTVGAAALEGALLILTVNGIPGINIEHLKVRGSIEPLDVCLLGLIIFAVVRYILHRDKTNLGPKPWIPIWSLLFALVWLVDAVRASDQGVPFVKAALFGREFLSFAILLPFAEALFAKRGDVQRLMLVAGFFILVFACGEILASFKLINPSLINAQHALKFGSVTRIYARMNDAVTLGFAMALAYALRNRGPKAKWAAIFAIVCGLSIVVQLTRALYLGLIIGLIVAVPIWIQARTTRNSRFTRRATRIFGAIVAIIALVAIIGPSLPANSPLHEIVSRINQGVANVGGEGTGRNNTLAYRQDLSGKMLGILGGQWMFGLSFLHPSAFYFPSLPMGSIRNADVGVLNVVMTMGVFGAVLWYIPMLLGIWSSRPGRGWTQETSWIGLGAMIWLITAVASSITLVTLYSVSGLALAATVLGLVFLISERNPHFTGINT
jgi:hypothetical protein